MATITFEKLSEETRRGLAASISDRPALILLAHDPAWRVRFEVSLNPETPDGALLDLQKDSHPLVSLAATTTLDFRT